jgi:pyruvate/2-oxoglutarate dehydrogenase complex dihydrolipoamide acyltransferase (E2) component
MPLFKRPDGTLVKDISPFRVLTLQLMRNRTESTIFIPTDMDVTKTLEFVDKYNSQVEEDKKIGIFTVLLSAIVRTCALRPQLNRFVINHRLYQRNELKFSFIVKKQKTEQAAETNATMVFDPLATLNDISQRLRNEIGKARSDKMSKADSETESFGRLPQPILRMVIAVYKWLDKHNIAPKGMIKTDPLYVTCYITNVGSIKMESPYHHLFEWGTSSLFIGIGQYEKVPKFDEKGNIVAKNILKVIVTYDDRISEGIYGARAIQLLRTFIENPEQLLEKPNISPEIIQELQLKPIHQKKASE